MVIPCSLAAEACFAVCENRVDMPVPQHQKRRGTAPLNKGAVDVAAGIRDICDGLQLVVNAVQAQQLEAYLALLQRWNAVYNLTAVRDPSAMLTQHLADCLAVIAPLARHLAEQQRDRAPRLLDVGSGAGLPGVVVAVMSPSIDVVCVDTVAKKASFVRQVSGELGLAPRLHSHHGRVEAMRGEAFDVVTSRAFSSLSEFVLLTRDCLVPDGAWLAMKGKVPRDEIAQLPVDVEMFHVEHLVVPGLGAERCLVWMRHRGASVHSGSAA